MSFALVFVGVVMGFAMAVIMFVRKIWDLQDRLAEEKHTSKFYKRECEKAVRQIVEWEAVTGVKSDLYKD